MNYTLELVLETFRSVLDEVVFSFQFKACQSAYFDAVYSLHCSDAALIARDRNTQVVSRILYTEIRNTSKARRLQRDYSMPKVSRHLRNRVVCSTGRQYIKRAVFCVDRGHEEIPHAWTALLHAAALGRLMAALAGGWWVRAK